MSSPLSSLSSLYLNVAVAAVSWTGVVALYIIFPSVRFLAILPLVGGAIYLGYSEKEAVGEKQEKSQ